VTADIVGVPIYHCQSILEQLEAIICSVIAQMYRRIVPSCRRIVPSCRMIAPSCRWIAQICHRSAPNGRRISPEVSMITPSCRMIVTPCRIVSTRWHILSHRLRTKCPAVCLAQAIGLGGEPIENMRGPTARPFGIRRVSERRTNGRAVGPHDLMLAGFPGRWPGLSKCLGLCPSTQSKA